MLDWWERSQLQKAEERALKIHESAWCGECDGHDDPHCFCACHMSDDDAAFAVAEAAFEAKRERDHGL